MKTTKLSDCGACGYGDYADPAPKSKNKGGCGGFKPPKGHMDSQMYPECSGTDEDRDVVKKTIKRRKKKNSCDENYTITYNGPKGKFNLKKAKLQKAAASHWECANPNCKHGFSPRYTQKPGLCPMCNSQDFTWIEEAMDAQAQTDRFVKTANNWECSQCGHKFSPKYVDAPDLCPMCGNTNPNNFRWDIDDYISLDEMETLTPDNIASLLARRVKTAKDKAEDFEKNPWAICTESIGKTEGTTERSEWSEDALERYERCVKKVKAKERK